MRTARALCRTPVRAPRLHCMYCVHHHRPPLPTHPSCFASGRVSMEHVHVLTLDEADRILLVVLVELRLHVLAAISHPPLHLCPP